MDLGERKYWNKEIETMPKEKLMQLQLSLLQKAVERAYHSNPFYKNLYDQAGVKPSDIKSLEDLQRLPLIEKKTIKEAYPFGLLISPLTECVEMHSTSGTTGKPVPVFITKRDIEVWSELNARELWMIGLRPGDILQNAYGYGLPTGGFGFHYGAIKAGIMVVPIGTGQTDRQIEMILDLGVKAVCMTPSYALYLGERAREQGINLAAVSNLKYGLFGAEPWPEATRARIEELLGITAYDEFGMTELLGPGMSCECEVRQGMHTWADVFLVECINPETGEPLPEGKEGELVWTWLTADGTAMIRYRSRDLSAVWWEECPCGRTHPKIAAIKGRTDDAVVVSGLVVFPSQIENVLQQFPAVGTNFRIYVDKDSLGLDILTLKVEVTQQIYFENEERKLGLSKDIQKKVKSITGVTPKHVELVKAGSLPRITVGEGKTASARVEDRRKK